MASRIIKFNARPTIEQIVSHKTVLKAVAVEVDRVVKRELVVEALVDFNKDEVTKELDGAMDDPANYPNTSGTLAGIENGNLYSFIGFPSGTKPTDAIRLEYQEKTGVTRVSVRGTRIRVVIKTPELKELYDKTPMPWGGGRSWAEGIQKGISGLSYFLSKKKGRSGGGIQLKAQIRSAKFKPVPYLGKIVRKIDRKMEKKRIRIGLGVRLR